MSRKKVVVLLVIALVMSLVPMNPISAQDPNAPVYMQFCDRIRDGDENLIAVLDSAETELQEIEDMLIELDNGRLTFSELVTASEQAITDWNAAVTVQCLAPLHHDVVRLFYEVLVSSLYGNLTDAEQTQAHRNIANDLFFRIRTEIQNARNYLSGPIPTATPTIDPAGPTPTATEPPEIRSSEELTQILEDFLRSNGVSVLMDAGVQVVPTETMIVIRLMEFVDPATPDENYDLPNTYFTLDVLDRLLVNWPELDSISRIIVETYNDANERVLFVEVDGADFRGYYYGGTLTESAFQSSLRVEGPEGAVDAGGDDAGTDDAGGDDAGS